MGVLDKLKIKSKQEDTCGQMFVTHVKEGSGPTPMEEVPGILFIPFRTAVLKTGVEGE